MEHGPCPLEEGDRIDHKKFGFGTVSGEPVSMMRGGNRGPEPAVGRCQSNGMTHGGLLIA